ncbi:hypothetical protein SAMN06265171_105189 [Chryseobacterium rhizoplanae]|uniref:Uncharacterized protein n=1 Tax=Chryseobacterium rhizoplanae TaxID=1609531 RepID=A0A521DJZ6_9FLAO|nr:hypothetical protein [Chryseobacterium rhizoplanae]SMO72017.1 hypothetical protein SAMN06265171_105189 [Chryseobacterium rhizoplanae]
MKTIIHTIQCYALWVDRKWKFLPVKRQRILTKFFLVGYTVLTILMIVSICASTGNKTNTMFIGHVSTISGHAALKKISENKDSVSQIKKKNYNERFK